MADIFAQGIKQGDLVDLLVSIRTKWNTLLTKLDADNTVGDTDYNSTRALSMPAGIQTGHPKAIRDQGQIVTYLNDFITAFDAVLAKLDLDSGVSGTNYVSLLSITDIVGAEIDPIKNAGLYDGAVVKLLDTIIAGIAALNAKLDLDGGVADTNYAALCNVTDNVDSTGGYLSYR
jgi:hypothetical protein